VTSLGDPEVFERIARNHVHHSRDDQWWVTENEALDAARPELRAELEFTGGVVVGPVGFVPFSYVEMGAINSLDLFGLDELILLAFYWLNRDRYRQAVDMGANIDLHSVLLGRLGLTVTAYEPDPNHVALLTKNLVANDVQDRVTIVQAAVARENGVLEFVRVLGNTTGSHVAGAKKDPYGELEVFKVQAVRVAGAIADKDLVKMDVEGLEADLLTSLDSSHFASLDMVCEVGTPENAEIIWNHFKDSGVNLFSQKSGWARVTDFDGMPCSYKEGSLFLSCLDDMPWGAA
jgi:FkbM family methyltransferase